MAKRSITVRCCIAGGGPAGMMFGLLLARSGVEVLVLEKHPDFLRDFRGDTIHPSTLEVMHELGLLEEFLRLPHQKVREINGRFGEETVPIADFSHLPVRCGYIAFLPQWDFLSFLAAHGARHPGFMLEMQAEAKGLIEHDGRIVGLRATTPQGELEVRAELVVGCDGRSSTVRNQAALEVETLGAPMDVLWFRLSRGAGEAGAAIGRFDAGRIFIMLDRDDYWQCAFVIPKGANQEIRARGLAAFRDELAKLAPDARERVAEIDDWDKVKLLVVQVDRLKRWYRPGLLCIGDAAHAMSPVAGVGINLAIQDAVAAANLLAEPLREGRLQPHHLQQVEKRRQWPTHVTQRLQLAVQNRVIARVLATSAPLRPPPLLRLFQRFPLLRRIPGRLIGMGVRPEHVRTGQHVGAAPEPAA